MMAIFYIIYPLRVSKFYVSVGKIFTAEVAEFAEVF